MSTFEAPPEDYVDAVRQAYGPPVGRAAFFQAYDADRAAAEYDWSRKRHSTDARVAEARQMIARMRAVADKHGWTWAAVVLFCVRESPLPDCGPRKPRFRRKARATA